MPPRPPLDRRQTLFTLLDVARLVNRSTATIRRWATDGRIPMEQIGEHGPWIIHRRELVAWLQDLRRLHEAELARWADLAFT